MTSINSNADSRGGSVPPWLWFWLILYFLSIPGQIRFYKPIIEDLFSLNDLFGVVNVPGLLPSFVLLIGVLLIFFPTLRASYLERRFQLVEPDQNSSALIEMKAFLQQHVPGIHIKTNMLRTDQLAFVYPLGYRNTGIALFGGLFRLWHSDRKTAEAVLLHEAAHCRHGDVLIVGAGSFFEALVKKFIILYLLLCFPPLLWSIASESISVFQSGIPFAHKLQQFFIIILPGSFLQLLGLLGLLTSIFVLPIIAVWSAEFNADRFVINQQKSSTNLLSALDKISPTFSIFSWIIFRLTHPPIKMRQWAAKTRLSGFLLILLLFPAAYFANLIALIIRALSGYLLIYNLDITFSKLANNIAIYFAAIAPKWCAMAVLFLLWPFLSVYWEQYFGGSREAQNLEIYTVYIVSALIVGLPALLWL
uniref:Peptidase M48 domain-containing protein n=1 Tax=Candidatus Methanogaster sp. ANME-2c ERB4 TaxID=2759911 RepID=A0A7G9YFB5_9EURY|nr:hypothetical protein BAIACGLI_00012 [Methanosarcinales archaeon ANME-2c ERB4]